VLLKLDEEDSKGDELQAVLTAMTGLGTVPNVWVGGKFIGDSAITIARLNAGDFDKYIEK